jgi:intein/homing endonuclease
MYKGKVALSGDAIGLTKPWSIDGEECIVIKDKNLIKTVKIGEFVDKNENNYFHSFSALSPTKNPERVDFFPINNFLKHSMVEDLYEIVTEKGYRVKTTASHSVIVAEDYKLKPKKVSELKPKKDHLLLTLKVPNNQKMKGINLIGLIINEQPELISQIRVKGAKKLLFSKQSKVPRNNRTSYWRNDSIPLKLFLGRGAQPKNVKISIEPSGGLWVNNLIKITPEFCRILGYYIAEGDSHNGKEIHISLGGKDIEKGIDKDISYCVEKVFGIKTSKTMFTKRSNRKKVTEFSLAFGGKMLSQIFTKVFKTGIDAHTKQIPYIIFNIPNALKMEFLKAYIVGDGTSRVRTPKNSKNRAAEISVSTVSRKLASDIITLSLQLELFPSIEEVKAKKHYCYGKEVNTSKSYKITFSSKRDLEKLIDVFSDKQIAKEFLKQIKVEKSTVLLPKSLLHKDIVFKINDKKLRKYFIDRLNAKWCKGLDYGMIEKALTKIDTKNEKLDFIKHIIKNKIVLLPIKEIKKVKPNSEVYDIGVENTNMFVGGLGPIVLHNSYGGITWGLIADDILIKTFPNFRKYEEKVRDYFEPKIFYSKIALFSGKFLGNKLSFLTPKEIWFDGDWVF